MEPRGLDQGIDIDDVDDDFPGDSDSPQRTPALPKSNPRSAGARARGMLQTSREELDYPFRRPYCTDITF